MPEVPAVARATQTYPEIYPEHVEKPFSTGLHLVPQIHTEPESFYAAEPELLSTRTLTPHGELILRALGGKSRILAEWFVLHPDVVIHPRDLHYLIEAPTLKTTRTAFSRGIAGIRQVDALNIYLHHTGGVDSSRCFWMSEVPGATIARTTSDPSDSYLRPLQHRELVLLQDFQGAPKVLAEWILRNPSLDLFSLDLKAELAEAYGKHVGKDMFNAAVTQITQHPTMGKYLHRSGYGRGRRYRTGPVGRLYTTLVEDADAKPPLVPYLDRELEMLELMETHPLMQLVSVELGCFVSDGDRPTYAMGVHRFLRKVAQDPEYKERLWYAGNGKNRKYWLSAPQNYSQNDKSVESPTRTQVGKQLHEVNDRITALESQPRYKRNVIQFFRDGKWQNVALCTELEQAPFFKERPVSEQLGLWTCAQCVVQDECLAAGIREPFGPRGGLTAQDRREVRLARMRSGETAGKVLIDQLRKRHIDKALSVMGKNASDEPKNIQAGINCKVPVENTFDTGHGVA